MDDWMNGYCISGDIWIDESSGSNDWSQPGILASDIFELSLASEASGTVGLAEVRDLAEPVYLRIRCAAG